MSRDAAAWTDLGGGVLVRRSRAFRMHSVLLLDPEHAVIVDPGVLPSELDDIAERAKGASPRRTTLMFTHAHWDHVLGRSWWPEAGTAGHELMTYEMASDADGTRSEAEIVAERFGERWPRAFEPFVIDESLAGAGAVTLGPWRIEFRDAPGHCDSSLTLHLPDQRVMIAGDLASDTEIPGLDGSPGVYRKTIEGLVALCDRGAIEVLIPGHGSIARGSAAVAARLNADLAYLSALERAVTAAQRDGAGLDEVRERLADMPIVGRDDPEYPTGPVHEQNLTHAFRAALAGATKTRNS